MCFGALTICVFCSQREQHGKTQVEPWFCFGVSQLRVLVIVEQLPVDDISPPGPTAAAAVALTLNNSSVLHVNMKVSHKTRQSESACMHAGSPSGN